MKALIQDNLTGKVLFPLVVGGVIFIVAMVLAMLWVKEYYLQQTGIQVAKSLSNQIVTVRNIYTSEVVSRVRKMNMRVHYNFAEREDTIPLPATMARIIGEQIGKNFPGIQIRLYSRFPFPHRKATEKYDDFERQALSQLEKDAATPVRQMEEVNGRLSIRYAIADVMQAECVACHNTDPESPKTDWKVGDVRGAVEVIVSLDSLSEGLTQANTIMFLLAIIGLLITIGGVFWMLQRSIIKPIKALSKLAEKASEGDLTVHTPATSKDEIMVLTQSFNTLIEKFQNILKNIVGLTKVIDQENSELSQSISQAFVMTTELADLAEIQSTSIEETAASVRQINVSASLSAEASKEADQISQSADTEREKSTEAVEQMRQSMQRINEASSQVNNFISNINDIANQTSLLSLNAAIEAAKAGEQGAGFAVVADEVRQLAENSSRVTKEIGVVIQESEQRITEGKATVEDVKSNLGRIHEKVTQTKNLVSQISVSTSEQQVAIDEINLALENLAKSSSKLTELSGTIKSSFEKLEKFAGSMLTHLNTLLKDTEDFNY